MSCRQLGFTMLPVVLSVTATEKQQYSASLSFPASYLPPLNRGISNNTATQCQIVVDAGHKV